MVKEVKKMKHLSGRGCNAGRFEISWGGERRIGEMGGLEGLQFFRLGGQVDTIK